MRIAHTTQTSNAAHSCWSLACRAVKKCYMLFPLEFHWGDPYSQPGYHKLKWREIFVINLHGEDNDLMSFIIERSNKTCKVYDGTFAPDGSGTMCLDQNSRPDLRTKYITQALSSYFPHNS